MDYRRVNVEIIVFAFNNPALDPGGTLGRVQLYVREPIPAPVVEPLPFSVTVLSTGTV